MPPSKTFRAAYSRPSPCGYLPGKTDRMLVACPPEGVDMPMRCQLSRMGFRRSGPLLYRPECEGCQSCRSSRVRVADFRPDRTMRRVWRRNLDLAFSILPLRNDPEHAALFRRYESSRHAGGTMDLADDEDFYARTLLASPFPTCLLEYRRLREDGAPGDVMMVSIVDILDDGLSAEYTFFEPDEPRRSLGTFGILNEIHMARRLGLPYVYLGFWIPECPKMAYKSRFQPLEIYQNGLGWTQPSPQRGTDADTPAPCEDP